MHHRDLLEESGARKRLICGGNRRESRLWGAKLCSHRGITRVCRRARVLTPHGDDAENSEVDRRDEVLEWLRASVATPRERAVKRLELIATSERAVLGIRDPEYRELAGVPLEGQLFVGLAVRDGEVVELRDYPRRDEALRAAGVADGATWR